MGERMQQKPVLEWDLDPHVELGAFGAEPPLGSDEQLFLDNVHRFGAEVMRPTGIQLDRMTPEQVMAQDSPYWGFRRKFLDLGVNVATFGAMEAPDRARLMPMVFEEFGWADAGLSVTIGACQLPTGLAFAFGNSWLVDRFPNELIGCWSITEPDHGSDSLDPGRQIFHARGDYGKPNCVVSVRKNGTLVINGQKSAWCSNGPIADVCVLCCSADWGDGADSRNGAIVYVPLDAKGISRGKSIDKLGQRSLPQGELYFDNVELSHDYLLTKSPDEYRRAVYAIHVEANGQMGAIFTGVARAAFELALAYAHERRQGGVPIIRHQSVAYRLFHMFRKVEASRALTRRVALFNATAPVPALHAAMTAKVTATQTAFEVASDALQIFCGNGNTRDYEIEKIFRDARASMIEDGCNEVLAIKGGCHLINEEQLRG
jgi:acyl-CoA dehydrogenase